MTAHILLSGLPSAGLPSDGARPGRLSLSADGRRLVHIRALSYSNLWLVDLDRPTKPMRPLTHGTSFFQGLRTGEPQLVAMSPFGSIETGDVTPGGGSLVVSVPERKADAWLIEKFDRRRPPKKP